MAFTFPKNYKNLSQEEKADWKYLKKIFYSISTEYKVLKASKPSLSDFQKFDLENPLKQLQSYNIQKGNNQFTLCLVEYDTSHQEASAHGGVLKTNTHKYLVGILNTTRDFGSAFIRPETIGDKISEYFSPTELDIIGFDKFNNNYYLLSSDKQKFIAAASGDFLHTIAQTKNMKMKFAGKRCLFNLKKAIDLNEAMELCKLGIIMSKNLQ